MSSSGQVHLLLHFILIRFHTTLLAACSCHWWVGYIMWTLLSHTLLSFKHSLTRILLSASLSSCRHNKWTRRETTSYHMPSHIPLMIGQLYKATSFLAVSTSFHSEMRRSVGNSEETTLFFHYNYQTKTCDHSVVKTTNLFLQCCYLHLTFCTWDTVTTCTPVTDFFPPWVRLCLKVTENLSSSNLDNKFPKVSSWEQLTLLKMRCYINT